jgi:DMSO/TMAO reductase YedYZ heme-binding membrane subunit
VAYGIVAMWLLVAVQLTSLARRRLSPAVWRGIHLTSYVVFWLTSIHAALAGSDTTNRLYQATVIAATMAVAWALMYRITNRGRRREWAVRDISARSEESPCER